ncbi:MAG: peptide chain release factor 2 [Candidatus Moraniibacteriota bacterium]
MIDLSKKVEELKSKLPSLRNVFDAEKKENRIREIGFKMNEDDFWNDHEKANLIMQELEELKKTLGKIEDINDKLDYFEEFLTGVSNDSELIELEKQIIETERDLGELEIDTLLGGEYDKNSAIVSIHSGAGGVDAQDWSEMLFRMYLRYAQIKKFKTKIIDEARGQEAGIKSVTFEIEGKYAYGLLKGEAGTHRLVRLSPFNSDNLRQTSFALVEVLPIIKNIKEVVIKDEDLRIDTFRSSGAGGQSVNTTDSAVRITHLPTNIVAACQTERSQLQNKERAMKLLLAKLHRNFLEQQELEKKKLKGEHQGAQWGSQIRSYVVHPYKLVKDHRSEFESTDPESVLNGNIDEFIEAFLRKNK